MKRAEENTQERDGINKLKKTLFFILTSALNINPRKVFKQRNLKKKLYN